MSIDLLPEHDGTSSWERRFGAHEAAGVSVYANAKSAHVTLAAIGIQFAIGRQDVPAAWAPEIDVGQLRSELIATIVRQMSAAVVEDLFKEICAQRQRALRDGETAAQTKIKEALGL